MRTALQIIVALVVGVVLLIVMVGGDARRATAESKAAEGELRILVGWLVGLALLAFWMLMAWRAVRALESIASTLRRGIGPPPDAPPPAAE